MPTKKSPPVSEWQTSWFRFKLADGRVVVAPAHGAGGLFRGTHGEKQIRRAIRAAEAGDPTGYYEPKPGHMLVWPQYSFADNGPEMNIPLAGATVRLVKATRERTRAHKAGKAALGPDDWAANARTKVHHATKKSPAQLQREIAEALKKTGYYEDMYGKGSTPLPGPSASYDLGYLDGLNGRKSKTREKFYRGGWESGRSARPRKSGR